MNQFTKYTSFLLIILSALFVDCKRKVFDYRNKYAGTWQFKYTIMECTYANNPPCIKKEGEYKGKINYPKKASGDEKKLLFVYFSNGYMEVLQVDDNGNLSGCGTKGKFDNKKNISFINDGSGPCTQAQGGSYSYTVSGTKINNKL